MPGVKFVARARRDMDVPLILRSHRRVYLFFYWEYRSSVKGKDEDMFDAALNSLRADPSLHPLLPYFTQFIADEVWRT